MGLVPPFIRVSPAHGSAGIDEPTLIEVEYSAPDNHTLQGTTLKVSFKQSALSPPEGVISQILVGGNGPGQNVYSIDLSGRSRRPAVNFSFTEKDFGPTFMLQSQSSSGATGTSRTCSASHRYLSEASENVYFGSEAELVITNTDASPCRVTATKLGDGEEFTIKLSDDLEISVGESVRVPIIFTPRELTVYTETVEFTLNGCTKMNLQLKGMMGLHVLRNIGILSLFIGRGVPLYLETESPESQTSDFGRVSFEQRQTVVKEVVLVNRSATSVTFNVTDLDVSRLNSSC